MYALFYFFYAERVLYSKHLPFASIQGEKKIVSSLLINKEQNSVLGYNLRWHFGSGQCKIHVTAMKWKKYQGFRRYEGGICKVAYRLQQNWRPCTGETGCSMSTFGWKKVLNKAALTRYTLLDWRKKLLFRTWVLWFLFWFLGWDSERWNQTVGEAEYIAFNINITDCIWATQMVLLRRQELLLLRSTIYCKISTNYIVWLKIVPLNLHDWMIL